MKRNRFRTCLCLSFFFLSLLTLKAQDNQVSGLNARQFHKYWKVESESPDYKVTFRGDTAEIVSPKGLTLWRKEKMSGKVTIEYDACVISETEKKQENVVIPSGLTAGLTLPIWI